MRITAAFCEKSRPGYSVYLRGEHGSGKTHTVRAAIGQVIGDRSDRQALPVYVRSEGPDFTRIYRSVMSQISLSEFKRLAALTLRSLAPDPGPIEAADHARLRNDPSLLYQMFKENVFERGVLLEAQADHLQRVTRDELDFERALTYIFEPDLQDAAFDWLCGNPVDQAVLSRLGISEISLLDRCRSGLQLLTFICDRAGSPLILILDQAEKFLLAEDGARSGRAAPSSTRWWKRYRTSAVCSS